MAKSYKIEIDGIEKKALELGARLLYEKLKKSKNLTPSQKNWLNAADKLYIFMMNLK